MSWLISLVIAGAMFASSDNGNLPNVNFNHENGNVKTIVQTEESERFEQTYPLNASGAVDVSNVNGSITIEVWDNPQVKLEYTKFAESRERLADVEIKIDARQDSIRVETDYENAKRSENNQRWQNGGKMRVEYHLTVPRGAVLNQIATVNGSINISNAAGATRASAVNGEVNATNLRGAANLSTVNGTVRAAFDALQAAGRITLETVNGTVELTVPSDANATVKADTLNGKITNDFGLHVRKGQFVGRNLHGRLGSGDAQIRLNSVNGELSIRRKNDGKNASPATNLLSNKNDEDAGDDDDDENETNAPPVKAPRPPRAPAPPAASHVEINNEVLRRTIEESLKDAQKEISEMASNSERRVAEEALKQAAAAVNSPETQAALKSALDNYKESLANANWTNAAPRIEDKSESFAVKGAPRVTIEAGDCAVSVRGWDKQEVRYAATRVSKTQTPFDLKATQDGSNVNIKVLSGVANKKNGDLSDYYFNESSRTRIEIFVPRKSDLKIKTGGEIRLEGVSGAMDLQGADESINVRDADGRLSVGTGDGVIRVIGFRGAFDGKTADGTMNLEGDFASFNALASGDGTIVLTLPDGANAVLAANAEIESEGIDLVRENGKEKLWRVGQKLGENTIYRMSVAEDGRVVVRGASALKTNF